MDQLFHCLHSFVHRPALPIAILVRLHLIEAGVFAERLVHLLQNTCETPECHCYNAPVRFRPIAALVVLTAACAAAQWIVYPTPGIPRTADGKANMNAPAPRTADGKMDLSGMWTAANNLPCDDKNRMCTDLPTSPQFFNLGAGMKDGLPYQDWAKEKIAHKGPTDDPYFNCIAPGGPRMHLIPHVKKFVQTPGLFLILNEYNANFRQIFLDGRPLPEDPTPTWNGYSTGHWDGDTLTVQSNGYRDDQWLDVAGSPLTSAAKVTERFRRPRFGRLDIEVTIDDPKAYTKPFSVTVNQDLVVDTDLLDAICAENEKDAPHLKAK